MLDILQLIENVKGWELRRGKKELLQHLEGGKTLTYRQAALAKCYDCCCGYPDGAKDCKISTCPLYTFMPFREHKVINPTGRKMSDEHKALLQAARVAKSESQ